jgi:hypothetical protein
MCRLADGPSPPGFERLRAELGRAGAQVVAIAIPDRQPAERPLDGQARLSELKVGLERLAGSALARLRGDPEPADWLVGFLAKQVAEVDAVVAVDPKLAALVFPAGALAWPAAVQVGVAGDYHLDPAWSRVPLDDLVVAHHALARDAGDRAARRVRSAGTLSGGSGVAERRLDPKLPQVVVSFAQSEPGDVDPLLFQLSLATSEPFSLLFLAAGRPGVDELVRARAEGYGLRAKRTRAEADPEAWIRGGALLVGHPSPAEAAVAVDAKVPILLYAPRDLSGGDAFLAKHGVAAHVRLPITLSVQLEGLLPGGKDRPEVSAHFEGFASEGARAVAEAVLEAARAGKPSPILASAAAPRGGELDELEDIGGTPPSADDRPITLPDQLRKAYLSEVILHQKEVERQLGRAKGGLDTWQNRARLATDAGQGSLREQASIRVEALTRLVNRLEDQRSQLLGLRDRFAGRDELTAKDREAVARLMTPQVAATLDRLQPTSEAFTRLEVDDALKRLKDRLKGS